MEITALLRRWITKFGCCLAWLVTVAAWPAAALAQASRNQPPAQQGHGEAIPYLLVLFCIVLGLIVLCRSAGRTTELTLQELDKD